MIVVAACCCAACLGPRPWWEQELAAWEGASAAELMEAWGPPDRTESAPDGEPTLVYESVVRRDFDEDALRDPSSRVTRESTESDYEPVDTLECSMYFEVHDRVVVKTWYDGAGCQVVPRDPSQRRPEPRQPRGTE
jgi:hypothetical protein